MKPLRWGSSCALTIAALVLAYAPLPGLQQTLVVVSGSELQEPLEELERRFEEQNPAIRLDLKIQGSQDMVTNYLAGKNDFTATLLIPASGDLLGELEEGWQAQNPQGGDLFVDPPQPIAKTVLVAVAWPDRGPVLFPQGQFQWSRLTEVLQTGRWEAVGGDPAWGSFNLVMTDPSRSNSGQLALGLWLDHDLGSGSLSPASLQTPQAQSLFQLVKRSIYQPARSTDILLQEFIAQGPNDADLALVYESIALHRWSQASTSQGRPYQIYYLDPSVETVATAAVLRPQVSGGQRRSAQAFLRFLGEPDQQAVFVAYGFRPLDPALDLTTVPRSPWAETIPGAQTQLSGSLAPGIDRPTLNSLVQRWQQTP